MGWADSMLMSIWMSGRTKTMGMRKRRPKAPPAEPTADLKMVGMGWADSMLMSIWMSGRTKTMGMRKRRPPRVLMTMVATMALGTWVEGSLTSSHMLMIMPVDEVA